MDRSKPFNNLRFSSKYEKEVLYLLISLMLVYAFLSIGSQVWRLLFDQSRLGAIDLLNIHYSVNSYFSGNKSNMPYPPASYSMLWPTVGWINASTVRWIWFFLYFGVITWLSFLLIRESKADKFSEKFFVVLLFLSINGTGQTIGTGQLGIFILPMQISGLVLIRENNSGSLWMDCAGAILLTISFVKPHISVPFFWMALFAGRLLPALIIILLYLLLSVISATFQEPVLLLQLLDWLNQSSQLGAAAGRGSNNIHNLTTLLGGFGIDALNIKISIFLLFFLGIWVYLYRYIDIWILLGVTGLFARLWTYHRTYDDVLIILPMIALFRLIKIGNLATKESMLASVLLLAVIVVNFLPSRILHRFPSPWPEIYSLAHISVWVAILIFLLYIARQQKRRIKRIDYKFS